MRRFLLATSVLALAMAPVAASAQSAPPPITSAEAALKIKPGSDYYLANYTQITAWLKTIAGQTDRMKLVSIGKTAEGREQYMAIVSSPENLANLERYRTIAQQLALAKGLTDEQARALAAEGKAMVWLDAGLHATEVVNVQTHVQMIDEMLTRTDAETMRTLNDTISLYVFANPDGLELVADWYMRPTDPTKRKSDTIPLLYQKYIGHDNNRDSFAANQAETTNMNRAMFREWFPQIVYNQHQTGPIGTVVFVPPFRDPFNYNYEPLVITQTDIVGYMMHTRLIEEGKPGSTMRSGAPYSTWFNGGVRTVNYFHNVIGILTEIIGSPTPMQLPLVPRNQLPRSDLASPIAPQPWHFQQSIDYVKTMNRAILDYASRYRETLLYNRYVMGRNQIAKGSTDSWVITPKRIDALNAEAKKNTQAKEGSPLDDLVGYNSRDVVDSALYETVLHDPAMRAPRAYILPADGQADMPTTIRFLNSLIKAGVEVQQAPAAFSFGGKSYAAGSYVVRTDQAFRPHVLDMFEPQDHPQDFAFPGGPPVKPYDITGYTLAYQMNVAFDRVLEPFAQTFAPVPDLLAPPPGRIVGSGAAGYVISHATNNSFTLTNRLLKAGAKVAWMKAPTTVAGATLSPGAIWVPASASATRIVTASVGPLGIDAYAVDAAPAGETIAIAPVRVGLVDIYGGSMSSGWTRWLFDEFEFPYEKVFPQELDKGGLNRKYDVLVMQSDVLPGQRHRGQPEAAEIPAAYRGMLGTITADKSYPQIARFARDGGTVIAIGGATKIGSAIGLPVSDPLTEADATGKRVPLPLTKFYVPGSVLTAKVDINDPLAFGMPETIDLFYNNSPVFTLSGTDPSVRRVSWFYNDDPLRSGWAWGQKALNGTVAVVDGTVGKGRVFLMGPEVTSRGQSHATFKFLFNGILYGPTKTGSAAPARAD